MKTLLVDLGRHQAWADAESWRALEKCPPARDDRTIHNRLHHIHFVQQAFCWLIQGKEMTGFPMTTPQDFPSFDGLRSYAQESSRAMADFISTVPDERLDERVQMPWLQRQPPFSIGVGEAFMQAVMHSQWHRGQNATRLRELGGEPPTLDLIVWYSNDRPAAIWDNPR